MPTLQGSRGVAGERSGASDTGPTIEHLIKPTLTDGSWRLFFINPKLPGASID